CGDLYGRLVPGEFVNAECGSKLPKTIEYFRRDPAQVTKFESVGQRAWQRPQKIFQPFGIHMPARRELEQNRTQLGTEMHNSRKNVLQSSVGIFQLFAVGQVSAGLNRK